MASDVVPIWAVSAAGLAALLSLQLTLPHLPAAAAASLAIGQLIALLSAVVDHREGRIPNSHVRWMLVSVILVAGVVTLVTGSPHFLFAAAAGAVGSGIVLTVVSLLTGGLGMGDVKLFTVLALPLWMSGGPLAVGTAVALACLGVLFQSASTHAKGVAMGPWIAVSLIPAALISQAL